jgi:glycosyltransferase involved in cell wall biosynthesis
VPVCFAVGIAPEIIKNGKNGFIVNSIEEAIEKIDLLLNDAFLRHNLALNAQKTATAFKSDILADKIISLYQNIINDQKTTPLHEQILLNLN